MRWFSWAHALCLSFVALGTMAQNVPSSNVAQCIPQYDWSISASGQTPCLLAAFLESACGTNTSINALDIGQMYQGPLSTEQDQCKCSSVTYILMSACAGCQNRGFVNWTTWCEHCDKIFREQFPKPLPSFIQIPPWAFMNVTVEGAFNPDLAQAIAANISATLSSAVPTATPVANPNVLPSSGSSTVTTPSSSTSGVATTSAADQATGGSSHSNVGPIVGGVIGGVVFGIAAVALGWFFCCRKKRHTEEQTENKQQVLDPSCDIVSPFVGSPVSETFSSPTSSPQALLFDHERIAAGAPNRSPRKFNRSRGTINRPVHTAEFETYEAPPKYVS